MRRHHGRTREYGQRRGFAPSFVLFLLLHGDGYGGLHPRGTTRHHLGGRRRGQFHPESSSETLGGHPALRQRYPRRADGIEAYRVQRSRRSHPRRGVRHGDGSDRHGVERRYDQIARRQERRMRDDVGGPPECHGGDQRPTSVAVERGVSGGWQIRRIDRGRECDRLGYFGIVAVRASGVGSSQLRVDGNAPAERRRPRHGIPGRPRPHLDERSVPLRRSGADGGARTGGEG
mmetsp:Transcript_30097/g.89499  ORF Transcript_30097/g.89499 Transcript_30097/m.89499 type:complete len:232 (+) Transcript_30097:481-1176(+)